MQGKYEPVGVIYVDTTRRSQPVGAEYEHHFTESHLHLLMAVGRHAALTVENQRYQQALIRAERMAAMGENRGGDQSSHQEYLARYPRWYLSD